MFSNLFNLGQWSRKGAEVCLILVSAMLATSSAVAEIYEVHEGTVTNSSIIGIDMVPEGTVKVYGGTFRNGIGGVDNRLIDKVIMFNGIGRNERGSTVTGSVNVLGGEFANDGTVDRGTVSGGTFMNNASGIVLGSLLMNDGTVNNGGTINNLVYGGAGTYNAFGNGSIGNLSLDARRQFDVDSLAGIAKTFGVGNIDFAGANLVWNLSGSLADNLGFFGWDDIFGVDFIGGEQVALFTVNWDDGSAEFDVDNFGQWQPFGGYEIIASMNGVTINPTVPEPATLAIIGLGLAGLGWARRRRK